MTFIYSWIYGDFPSFCWRVQLGGKPFGTETLLWAITTDNIVDKGKFPLTCLIPELSVQSFLVV